MVENFTQIPHAYLYNYSDYQKLYLCIVLHTVHSADLSKNVILQIMSRLKNRFRHSKNRRLT